MSTCPASRCRRTWRFPATLAARFERVTLWVYESDLAERMRASRINDVYLPGFAVPANVEVSSDLGGALRTRDALGARERSGGADAGFADQRCLPARLRGAGERGGFQRPWRRASNA